MEYRAPEPDNAAPLTAAAVAELVGGTVHGDPGVTVRRVQALDAQAEEFASYFLAKGGHAPDRKVLQNTRARLVLVSAIEECPASAQVLVSNPALAAALLAQHFDLARPRLCGIHERAFVHPSARLGEGVTIHAHASVEEDCILGNGVVLHAGVVLYPGTRVGAGTVIHANSVIGADGFGYVWSGSRHEKVPQQGWVEIGVGVEIGAHVGIDRGTFGPTQIGDGCIIDNQVQIGHNCKLGRFVILCAHVGLSGSTTIGDGALLGGRAASAGHLHIGSRVKMAGNCVATKDIADGKVVGGYPAWDLAMEKRMIARMRRLVRGQD